MRPTPRPGACRHAWAAGLALIWLAASLSPAAAGSADRDAGLVRLVGVWQLDVRVSEDPRRLLHRQQAPPRDPHLRGKAGREPAPQSFDERVKMVTEGADVLTIAYHALTLTITDWNDAVRTLEVDGKSRSVERQGVRVDVEAGWKGSDRLIVTSAGAPGGWIRETYELGGRGELLFVTVELQRLGLKEPLTFRRLYNKTGASQ
jgi:hypothetical protein